MKSTPRRIPDWKLERLALGELPAAEASRCLAELAEEPGGLERYRALQASDAEILAEYPVEQMALGIEERLAQRRAPRAAGLRWQWAAPALAGLAAVLAVVVFLPQGPGGPSGGVARPAPEELRDKGLTPFLRVYRRGSEPEPERLEAGSLARGGDQLQLRYGAAGRRFGLILSLDGAGAVTLHAPAAPGLSVALRAGDEVALDFSYELDDAPDFERFVFVTSDAAFSTGPVLAAAQAVADQGVAALAEPLPLPPGLEQSSFVLRKVAR